MKMQRLKTEEIGELKKFLESTNVQYTEDDFHYPMYVLRKNGKIVAYVQKATVPVYFSAWSTDPREVSPRELQSVVAELRAWEKMQALEEGRPMGFVSLHKNHPKFKPSIMKKLDFYFTGEELWGINK